MREKNKKKESITTCKRTTKDEKIEEKNFSNGDERWNWK